MKTINYIFTIILAMLSLTSCIDDFLDTKSPSKQTDENAFNNVSYTNTVLAGIYATLTEATIYGQKIPTCWNTNSDIEFAALGLATYNAITRDAGASNYYAVAENQNVKWDKLYNAVEQAATTIEGIRASPQMETSNKRMMQAMLGEALTLRALCYFELVKHWGDVPFKNETSDAGLSNIYMGKTDRDTIYAKIIEDLLEAEEYLPWMGKSVGSLSYSAPDKVTKGFCKALTARIALHAGGWSIRDRNQFPETTAESNPKIPEMNGYFTGRSREWRKYYEIAVQQCAEILGDTENPHALDPSFENVWKTVCGLQYNSYNENLFEIAFGLGNNGDIGSIIGMRLDSGSEYGSIGLSGSTAQTTAYYFYSFAPEDTRRDVTTTNISISSDTKEKFNSNPTSWFFAKWRIYWMTDGYLALHKAATSGRVGMGINWIVMRYSDVLLMFAEAQNELAGADAVHQTAGISAREALMAVRQRAFGSAVNTTNYASDFFEAIVHERAWEFGGEAIRKYDLIRWGLLVEKTEEAKEAMCRMCLNKGMVKIFDKSYDASQLPTKIYYKYQDAPNQRYIDRSSINFYNNISEPTATGYSNSNWLSTDYGRSAYRGENFAKILVTSTGLNASYDYSALIAELDDFEYTDGHIKVGDIMLEYPIGNGICNYRHPFSIYYTNLNDARGTLQNSYGY